jgi:hypothetical protein
MCRALKVLCAAPVDQLAELKRAAVSATWELVGGAVTADEVGTAVAAERPDVVVIDESLTGLAVAKARRAHRTVRVVGVGSLPGVDVSVQELADLREAILGLQGPGGPVRV